MTIPCKKCAANIKCALINQSNHSPVVFIVMGIAQNFNVKRGRLR